MNTKKLRAVFYGRHSLQHSNQVAISSIEKQRNKCFAVAESQNAIIQKEYIDYNVSARNDDRPQFQQLITDAKKGLFDIVYIYTIDRFSRNKFDIEHYENELEKAGARLISAMEHEMGMQNG